MIKILILCTGNSCRSQMAEACLKEFLPDAEVFSAGTNPSDRVHPLAVKVMAEDGIDISHARPEKTEKYNNTAWDYVITVCDNAKENCPYFTGEVRHRLHIGFDDPAEAVGTEEFVLKEFRRIRDEIKQQFSVFANSIAE